RRAGHTGGHRQVPDVLRAPGTQTGTRGKGAGTVTEVSGCGGIRLALGVYVLGGIDPAARALVDAHLRVCPDCREELAGLAGLPALLGRVRLPDIERLALDKTELRDLEEPPAELLDSLLGQISARRRARRWRGVLVAAAAAIIAIGGGIGGGGLIPQGPGVPPGFDPVRGGSARDPRHATR